MMLTIDTDVVAVTVPATATLAAVTIDVTGVDDFLALREQFSPDDDLKPGYEGSPSLWYKRYGVTFNVRGPKEAAIEPIPEAVAVELVEASAA